MKHKPYEALCLGDVNASMINYVKYAPSTCNAQPWLFKQDLNQLTLHYLPKDKMIVPKDKVALYNTIDLGIMLFACELWLRRQGISFRRELIVRKDAIESGDVVATYSW